jgi:hypothetical protein
MQEPARMAGGGGWLGRDEGKQTKLVTWRKQPLIGALQAAAIDVLNEARDITRREWVLIFPDLDELGAFDGGLIVSQHSPPIRRSPDSSVIFSPHPSSKPSTQPPLSSEDTVTRGVWTFEAYTQEEERNREKRHRRAHQKEEARTRGGTLRSRRLLNPLTNPNQPPHKDRPILERRASPEREVPISAYSHIIEPPTFLHTPLHISIPTNPPSLPIPTNQFLRERYTRDSQHLSRRACASVWREKKKQTARVSGHRCQPATFFLPSPFSF